MSSAERILQKKIENLEIQLISKYDNVHNSKKIAKKYVEDMRQNDRVKKHDGIYLRTIDFGGKESHGILINKETQPDNSVIFYIYEPNGRSSFNSRYNLSIVSNGKFEIDLSMTPENSINDDGHCAVWCIIVIILWNSFENEDRWTALDLFNKRMRSSYKARKLFMDGVLNLLTSGNDFDTQFEVNAFVEEVSRRIKAVNVAPIMR
jgi:hypothetical protein